MFNKINNTYDLGPLCKLRDWIPIQKLSYLWLSANPNAIHLLEQNICQINWYWLSKNPNAIHLLEKNMDKIRWHMLSTNPFIFEYDWVAMRNRMNLFKEELVAKQFHPRNMAKFVSWGFEEFDDLEF